MTDLFRDLAESSEPQALRRGLIARRVTMTVFAAVVVAALAGVIGQQASSSTVHGPAARMTLRAPERVRGGLFFQSRVDIRALRDIQHPRLVLARGWVEEMQVNSIEPNPTGEASRDGDVVLSYDTLKAGDTMVVWLQFEVNPTGVGRRTYDLELDDAEQPIARVHRAITVLP